MKSVDPEVGNIEREAQAVAREAFALEREAGGLPTGEPTLQDLLTDAKTRLEPEDDEPPFANATWRELLTAARITMDLCNALQDQPQDEDQRRVLVEQCPIITGFHDTIERQISPPRAAARKSAKRHSAP
jgi:hypothetical protein